MVRLPQQKLNHAASAKIDAAKQSLLQIRSNHARVEQELAAFKQRESKLSISCLIPSTLKW
jgi:hypothetical protein